MFGADPGSPAQSPDGAGSGSVLQFREATAAASPGADPQDVSFVAAESEGSVQFRPATGDHADAEESTLQFRPASGEEEDAQVQKIQFRPASGEEEDSDIRFRPPAGEESSSVVLVQPAPNAPGKKRDREEGEASIEVVKRRKAEVAVGGAQVDTSPPVRILDDEYDIDDAMEDAFGENAEEEEKRSGGMGGAAKDSDVEKGQVEASIKVGPGTGKMKVLSGGEIDDALDDAFGDNDAEDEPEDVAFPALPTEGDTAEEGGAKERLVGDATKDKDAGKRGVEKAVKVKADRVEGYPPSEPVDEITPVYKDKVPEKAKEKSEAAKNAAAGDKMEIDTHEGTKVALADGAKGAEAGKEKEAAKEVTKSTDGKATKDAAGEGKPADKNTDSPNKSTEGKKKDSKLEQQPNHVDSEDEEVPLDLLAIAKYEHGEVAKLTPIQQRRYEQYRRSDLKNPKVKKVLVSYNPALQKASDLYVIAVKGLAKLFVGDVVECALDVKKQMGDKGALQPKHLREAYRRLRRSGVVPSTTDKSASFS